MLTGVNLGCFRDREAGLDLAGLLEAVAALDGVERVRLSSIEVNHLSDRLLRAVADTPGVARHLHVPMQSGSDRVLGAMRRHYAAAGFLGKMHRARELVDGINLTSDVIVGHPSERVEDFGATLDAVSAAGFTKVHVFPYSPRPGTADAGDDPVTRRGEAPPLAPAAGAVGCPGPPLTGRPRWGGASGCWWRTPTGAATATTTRRSASPGVCAAGCRRCWACSRPATP